MKVDNDKLLFCSGVQRNSEFRTVGPESRHSNHAHCASNEILLTIIISWSRSQPNLGQMRTSIHMVKFSNLHAVHSVWVIGNKLPSWDSLERDWQVRSQHQFRSWCAICFRSEEESTFKIYFRSEVVTRRKRRETNDNESVANERTNHWKPEQHPHATAPNDKVSWELSRMQSTRILLFDFDGR